MSDVRHVAAAVILRGGCVLVQTRTAPGRWEGYWEFPGGGVEPGETAVQAVRRECREELGVDVVPRELLHVVRWSYGERRVEVAFLRCELPDDAAEPVALEQQRLDWADRGRLGALRFLPANAEVLRLIDGLLSAGD